MATSAPNHRWVARVDTRLIGVDRLAKVSGAKVVRTIVVGVTVAAALVASVAPPAAQAADSVALTGRCGGSRGVLSASITNTGPSDAQYALRANTLSPRRLVVSAGSSDELLVGGVSDGDWRLVLDKNGVAVASRTVTIECDPVDDKTGTVTSCMAGRGRVDVYVRNEESARREVTVTVVNGGRSYERRMAVASGRVGRTTLTGLRDGAVAVSVGGIAVAGTDGYRFVSDVGCGAKANESPPVLRVAPSEASQLPHDASSFTQGLTFTDDGRLFESSGAYQDQTRVREIDPGTGAVLRQVGLGDSFFGEGLAAVDGTLWLLSWRQGIARVLDQNSLEVVAQHTYTGQGWGLCYDGTTLIRSDGSSRLYRHRLGDFAEIETIDVTKSGKPVTRLNELECEDGHIWANVWLTDTIVRVEPGSGAVDLEIDVGALGRPRPTDPNGVANGIARDPRDGNVWLTGKLWTTYTRVELPSALGG